MGAKIIPILVMTVMLAASGCASRATEAAYRDMLDSYRGQHIDSLVADWGPAQGRHTFADGRQMYSFVLNRREYVEPALGLGLGLGLGWGSHRHGFIGGYYPAHRSRVREESCETKVITDRRGRIIDLSYRGNACRALPPAPPDQGRDAGQNSGYDQSQRR